MSVWKYEILGEVAKVKGRIGWKGYKTSDLREFGPIVFSGTEIKSQSYIDFSKVKHLTQEKYDESPEIMLKDKDIMVATRGSLGQIGFYKKEYGPATINPSLVIVSEFKGIPEFLYYYFISNIGQESILAQSSGTTIPAIYQADLKKIKVPFPSLNIQSSIAEILSSLDDKIEINNKINQELESLAQLLFKRWFVEFEFPNENGEPYKSLGGEMVDSELGEIPKGWTVCKIDNILEVKGGTTPSTKEPQFWDGEFNWTSPKDLSDLKFPLLLKTDKKITSLGLSKVSSGLLPKGTLLLSSRAPIGYLAITEIETAINQGYIAINCKNGYSNLFMLYWLKQNMDTVIARANGSTFLEISKSNFREILIVKPELEIHEKYITQVSLMFESLKCNLKENEKLITIRDLLLPKLISGELQINEN